LQPTPKPEPVKPTPPSPEKLVDAEKPAVPSQVPLFLYTIYTPPLLIKLPGVPSDNFTYSIIDAENKPALLQDHKKDGNLRLGAQETIFKLGHLTPFNEFEVGKPFTHVELQKYASKFPLRLLTHKDDKSEAFRFWFIHQTSQKPLLEHPLHSEDGITELRNNGTMIVVNQNAIQLPGKLQESVWLETPDEFMPGSKAAIYLLIDMHLDLSEIIRRLNEQRTTILKQRDLIQIPVRETVFKQFEESAKRQLSEEGSKKYSTSKPVNDIQRCGAMLEQYAYDITHIGLNSSSKIPSNEMKNCGAALLKANQEFEEIRTRPPEKRGPEYTNELGNKNKQAEDTKKKAIELTQTIRLAIPSLGADMKNKADKLNSLWSMFDLTFGNQEAVENIVSPPREVALKLREPLEKSANRIQQHPLLNRSIPNGRYRLFVDYSKPVDKKTPSPGRCLLLEFVNQGNLKKQ